MLWWEMHSNQQVPIPTLEAIDFPSLISRLISHVSVYWREAPNAMSDGEVTITCSFGVS